MDLLDLVAVELEAVGDGEWADTSMLADEVQIRFKLALTGLAPL